MKPVSYTHLDVYKRQDLNNTIVTGQKSPFFADPDQPYNAVMANVALRAKADKIILGGMGLSNDDFLYFKQVFENAGALDRIVSFVNTTENPPVERLLVPDMALTAAEYFAVDKGEKVLVLLTDMTLYADALAIVSNRMDQIPSKDSMPGSLYSDLAKIYEKAVQLPNGGSITIIAVTTLSGCLLYTSGRICRRGKRCCMPCVSVGGVGAGPGCIPESVTRGHGVTNKKFKYNKHKFLWKTNFNS